MDEKKIIAALIEAANESAETQKKQSIEIQAAIESFKKLHTSLSKSITDSIGPVVEDAITTKIKSLDFSKVGKAVKEATESATKAKIEIEVLTKKLSVRFYVGVALAAGLISGLAYLMVFLTMPDIAKIKTQRDMLEVQKETLKAEIQTLEDEKRATQSGYR